MVASAKGRNRTERACCLEEKRPDHKNDFVRKFLSEVVRHLTFHQHRRICEPLALESLLKLNGVIQVGLDLGLRIFRRDDQRPIDAERLLTVGVLVAVIKVR
jgi:hypothetical protein